VTTRCDSAVYLRGSFHIVGQEKREKRGPGLQNSRHGRRKEKGKSDDSLYIGYFFFKEGLQKFPPGRKREGEKNVGVWCGAPSEGVREKKT